MPSKEPKSSVLASLTAEIVGEKTTAAKGAGLTPLPGEGLPLGAARIPNDTGMFMSNEVLHDHAKQLRKFAADSIAIADGLDALLAESSTEEVVAPKVDPRFEGKDPEPEAEATEEPTDFAKAFAEKSAAAQAAAFKAEPVEDEWVCPDHGKAGVPKVSAKGRDFIGCPDCNKFKA